jgi:hypothetical protein
VNACVPLCAHFEERETPCTSATIFDRLEASFRVNKRSRRKARGRKRPGHSQPPAVRTVFTALKGGSKLRKMRKRGSWFRKTTVFQSVLTGFHGQFKICAAINKEKAKTFSSYSPQDVI